MSVEGIPGDRVGSRLVVASFAGPYNAGQALAALREAGGASGHVSVVAKNSDTRSAIVEQTGMGEPQDAGADTLVGALTGGALGGLAGLGALVIPGLGPILVAGALATAIGGAAIGAAVGGQIGEAEERGLAGAGLAAALIGQGVPATDARSYEARVRDNAILITVQAPTEAMASSALRLLVQRGGEDAHLYGVVLRRERI